MSSNSASTLTAHLAERVFRDADAAGLGNAFQPRGDVDAIAVDVAVFDDDVAKVDTDPEGDPLPLWRPGIALDHPALHGERAGDGFDHTRELDQKAVAGGLDDLPAMLMDFRSINSRRWAFTRARVPSSSAPMSQLYPAMSAARIAASRRFDALRGQSGAP
jgi:hypothetical protein